MVGERQSGPSPSSADGEAKGADADGDVIHGAPTGPQNISAAIRAYKQGKRAKAKKMVCSHGVADRTEANARAGADMLPRKSADLVLPEPVGDQLDVSVAHMVKLIRKKALMDAQSVDFYGFADDKLRGVCGVPELPGKPSYIWQEARMRRLVLLGVIPPQGMQIMNASNMNQLNKVSRLEQQARIARGEAEATRPVVAATTAPKTPYGYALRSAEGLKFVEGLQQIQKGIGVSSGCQRVAFTARANYEAGGASATEDCKNGFPATLRQKMADAWHRRFPAAGRMYNCGYGEDSIVLIIWYDEEGLMHILVRNVEEGSKQGCVLGNGVFCAAAQDVFEVIAPEFPDFEFLAIIDDLTINISAQPNDSAWHRVYRMYAKFHHRYKVEWAKWGITVAKSTLLIPPNAPWPKQGVMPSSVRVTNEGYTLLGADIGKPSFRKKQGEAQVDVSEWQLAQVSKLREGEENFISMGMAIKCINVRMHYYVRVNPPCGFPEAIRRHDEVMRKHNSLDLQLEGLSTPNCSAERFARADALLDQPSRASAASMGRTPLAIVAPAAFCAGVLDAAAFPEFCSNRRHLDKFCSPAYADVRRLLGEDDQQSWNKRLSERFPPSASDLTSGPFATNLLLKFKKTRVQGELVKVMMKRKLAELDASNSVATHKSCERADLTEDDAIAYHVQRRRSWASRALNGISPTPELVPNGKHFVPYMRFMLLLPQLTRGQGGGAVADDRVGASLDRCLRCRWEGSDDDKALLDIFGNHVCACKASHDDLTQMHDDAVDCIYSWFGRFLPGLRARHEPSAPFLMSQHYTEEECSLLFHGTSTVPTRRQAALLRCIIDDRNASTGRDRQRLERKACAAMAALRAVLVGRRTSMSQAYGKRNRNSKRGIRPDIALWPNGARPREFWADFTGSHDTSSAVPTTKTTLNLVAAAEVALSAPPAEVGAGPAADKVRPKPLPAISMKSTAKTTKFGPLVDAAVAQHEKGNRPASPTFLPFVLTSRGSIGAGGVKLIYLLKEEYIASLCRGGGSPRDGMSPERKAKEFDDWIMNSLMLTHLKGMGRLLARAGGLAWR